MKKIRKIIMGYAWKLAKKQAIKDNCSARECLSWALTRAWDEYKHCENGISGIKKTAEIKYEVREIKTPDGKKIYGVFECGKTGMIDYSPSKSYADRTAKYYTNFMKGVKK